jgi:hypothetical protein
MNGRMNAAATSAQIRGIPTSSTNNPDITDTSPYVLGTCAIHSANTAVGYTLANGCLVFIG